MTSGTPSSLDREARPSRDTARSSTWPPERTTQIEPKVWSKIASSGTRESMQPSTTACGCCPPEAAAAADDLVAVLRAAADESAVAGDQLGERVGWSPTIGTVAAVPTSRTGRPS